jgi:hypothetical protein
MIVKSSSAPILIALHGFACAFWAVFGTTADPAVSTVAAARIATINRVINGIYILYILLYNIYITRTRRRWQQWQ